MKPREYALTNLRRLLGRTKTPSEHFAVLARARNLDEPANAEEVWSHYFLGRYVTVARAPCDTFCWKAALACAVSSAATGNSDRAMMLARRVADNLSLPNRIRLSRELATYLPCLALEIAPLSSVDLRAALHLELGDFRQASKTIADALGKPKPKPDLILLDHAIRRSHEGGLQSLNRFLEAEGLSPVALVNEHLPATPSNLLSAASLTATGGPLVSVVMTAFNTEQRVTAAISSLLAQSYNHLEIIVVDDCSTDATSAAVEAQAEVDSRVRLVRLPLNCGPYGAKTVGMALARGEFVTCHDSDDWSHPLKLQMQVAPLLADPAVVCTISNWVRIDDTGRACCRQVYPLSRLNPSSPLFRSNVVFGSIGGYDLVRSGADSEFIARMRLVFGEKAVVRIRQPLSFGARRSGSLMTGSTTGVSGRLLTPVRLTYWERWTAWLAGRVRCGETPLMPAPEQDRPFPVPDAIALTATQLGVIRALSTTS